MSALDDLTASLAKFRTAKRVSGLSASYKKDNPTEYGKVIAFLDGGARPTGVTTDMGMALLLEEDARRSLVVAPASIQMGVQFHGTWSYYTNPDRTAVLTKMAAAGIEWIRFDVSWWGIEDTAKGARAQWYMDMVDYSINEANRLGLKVLVTLWLTPPWARSGGNEHTPPTNVQDYADFAKWAAGNWKGRVHAWEVWNEPDPSQTFWGGTPAQLVALMKAAYPAFKAGDPSASVVFPAPAHNNDVWIRQIYQLGAKGSFDIMATHGYQGLADAPPEYPDDGNVWWFTHMPKVKAVMDEYGHSDMKVWVTEYGWSAHDDPPGIEAWRRGVTEAEQADFIVRSIDYTVANYPYVTHLFWYKERSLVGGTDPHQEGYALLRSDLSERPAYGALKGRLT